MDTWPGYVAKVIALAASPYEATGLAPYDGLINEPIQKTAVLAALYRIGLLGNATRFAMTVG